MSSERYADVSRVLTRVLFLNLAVAVAKIGYGYSSGAISILSDGFHSLTDTASNVVGLVGVHAARRPPDDDHPYGHRKYETVAAIGVVESTAVTMRAIEALPTLSQRLTLLAAVMGFYTVCLQSLYAAVAWLRDRLAARYAAAR